LTSSPRDDSASWITPGILSGEMDISLDDTVAKADTTLIRILCSSSILILLVTSLIMYRQLRFFPDLV